MFSGKGSTIPKRETEEKLLIISEGSNKNRNQKETVAMIESRCEEGLKFNSVDEISFLCFCY